MKLFLVAVGHRPPAWAQAAFDDYAKRFPAELKLDFLGTGRVGDVRVRAGTTFYIAPSAAFETAEISAYWSKSDHLDWEGDLIYEASSSRIRARVTQVRRLNSFNLALTAEAASDGSLAFGFNLNFSLDPNQGLFFSRKPLAQAGSVRATVYRDLNDNGVHDANVLSWVRESEAALDEAFRRAVAGWLTSDAWPFERPLYEPLLRWGAEDGS